MRGPVCLHSFAVCRQLLGGVHGGRVPVFGSAVGHSDYSHEVRWSSVLLDLDQEGYGWLTPILQTMDATTLPNHSSAGRIPRFALFEYGFRPFFLLAGLYALLSVPLWLWVHAHGVVPMAGLAPQFWHGHEMIYGFVTAAIAGFLLTAVPSWTGARGFGGGHLIFLTVLWIAGRVAFIAGDRLPFWIVAVAELSFLPALALMLTPPLMRASNRNTPMLFVLGVLWLGDAAFIAGLNFSDTALAQRALHLAINLVLVLVSVVGGRIVPAFTANALRRRGGTVAIDALPWLDRFVIAVMIAVAVVDAFATSTPSKKFFRIVQWT